VKSVLWFVAVVIATVLPAAPQTSLSSETSNNTAACDAPGSPLYCQAGFADMADSHGVFNAAPTKVSKIDIHSLLYSGATTKVFAYYMPWYCMNPGSLATGAGTNCQSHIQVGYNGNDANTVDGQINDIKSRGFDGVVVAYYAQLTNHDQITQKVRDEIQSRGMKFALMEDQGAFTFTMCPIDGGGTDRTQCIANAINSHIDYTNLNYFSYSSYLRVDPTTKQISSSGRPVLFFFICEECFVNPKPDWASIWSQVRAHAKTISQGEPLFIFRNPDSFTHTQTDGGFGWIGMSSTDPYGLNYSNYFYDQSIKYPSLLTWGSAWKGFDDSAAPWTQNRYVSQQCGRTWLQVFASANRDYNTSRQLPFLGVMTWNDYEEGSETESGIDNCLSLSASVSGSTLSWQPSFSDTSGSEETVARYVVFEGSADSLTQVAQVSTPTHSLDLTTLNLPQAKHTLFVQAVGKPSIKNKMSAAVTYDNSAPAQPILALTPTTMTFSSTVVGVTTAPKTATLTNSGGAAATISSITTTGDFKQTTTCGTTLAAKSSCTISITFTPIASGTRTGTTTVVDSASGSPRKIQLSGTGTTTCSLPSSAGVRVCSPLNGSPVVNPVRALARGRVNGTFKRMELWIDGLKKNTSTTSTIDVKYTLVTGSHKFLFYAYNTAGQRWSAQVTATVK
jgi:hypothetical protein